MEQGRTNDEAGGVPFGKVRNGPKFGSVRRVFRIMDLVRQRGSELTAKQIAREVGTSLSSAYYLLNILHEEGYVEKEPRGGGYRLGPAISVLGESVVRGVDEKIEPVLEELAQRAGKNAYFAVLSDGEVTVTQVKAPPRSPPVGVVQGFRGAAHALALGKVLLAGEGNEYVDCHIEEHGLEAFTPRTILRPDLLHAQLNKARMVGLATDFEEFSPNLCCVAAPVMCVGGKVEGAIGLSTTARRVSEEGRELVELVQWAAVEASVLLGKER